ncbi:hypothetical protein BH10ACI2_BH10ACI2_14820 [soil metagenome]
MKKILIVIIAATSIGLSSMAANASPAAPANVGGPVQIDRVLRQIGRKHHRNNRNNNNNVRFETRIVHKGNKTYRDTYRITYKNGKEKSKRVSHVRIN